jgi:phage-related protein
MEEFSILQAETKLKKALTIAIIEYQFLLTLLKLVAFLGAIYLLSLLWPLMSSLMEAAKLVQQAVELVISFVNDFLSFSAELVETLDCVYGICTNIVHTILKELQRLATEIVDGVKKAMSSWC